MRSAHARDGKPSAGKRANSTLRPSASDRTAVHRLGTPFPPGPDAYVLPGACSPRASYRPRSSSFFRRASEPCPQQGGRSSRKVAPNPQSSSSHSRNPRTRWPRGQGRSPPTAAIPSRAPRRPCRSGHKRLRSTRLSSHTQARCPPCVTDGYGDTVSPFLSVTGAGPPTFPPLSVASCDF